MPLAYRIPAKAAGQRGRLFFDPGFPFPFESGDMPTTITGMQKLLRTFVRNDQFEGRLSFFTESARSRRSRRLRRPTAWSPVSRRVKVIVE